MIDVVFKTVDAELARNGFVHCRRDGASAEWIREKSPHFLTRGEIGLQRSSLERERVVGTLRISIRSSVWKDLEDPHGAGGGFKDVLTREWGVNGIFPYGFQRWRGWKADDVESIRQDLRATALPWLDRHEDPVNLVEILLEEIREGPRANPGCRPLLRRLIGTKLSGSALSSPTRVAPVLKERLGELYFGLGDIENATKWFGEWLADQPAWTQRDRYQRRIDELRVSAPSASPHRPKK